MGTDLSHYQSLGELTAKQPEMWFPDNTWWAEARGAATYRVEARSMMRHVRHGD